VELRSEEHAVDDADGRGASVATAGAIRRSPSGLWTESPWAPIAARSAPRASKLTSAPAAARRGPR
jgi:hypothetical protein